MAVGRLATHVAHPCPCLLAACMHCIEKASRCLAFPPATSLFNIPFPLCSALSPQGSAPHRWPPEMLTPLLDSCLTLLPTHSTGGLSSRASAPQRWPPHMTTPLQRCIGSTHGGLGKVRMAWGDDKQCVLGSGSWHGGYMLPRLAVQQDGCRRPWRRQAGHVAAPNCTAAAGVLPMPRVEAGRASLHCPVACA